MQFGFATSAPPAPAHGCLATSASVPSFTSGMRSGTDGDILCADAFVQTRYPASASAGSHSLATSAGRADRINGDPSPPVAPNSRSSSPAASSGGPALTTQFTEEP